MALSEREANQRVRRPWRLADTATASGSWYIFDDEEHQIARFTSAALAAHIVQVHNDWLEQQ